MKKKTIGGIIRARREELKLTRKQVADYAKVTAGYIALVERDRNVYVSPRLVASLDAVLKTKISDHKKLIVDANTAARNKKRAYQKKVALKKISAKPSPKTKRLPHLDAMIAAEEALDAAREYLVFMQASVPDFLRHPNAVLVEQIIRADEALCRQIAAVADREAKSF